MTTYNFIKLVFSITILGVSINTTKAMNLDELNESIASLAHDTSDIKAAKDALAHIDEININNIERFNNEDGESYSVTLSGGSHSVQLKCDYSRKYSITTCFLCIYKEIHTIAPPHIHTENSYRDIPVHSRYFDILKKIAEREQKLKS